MADEAPLILVVEDDDSSRFALVRRLRCEGWVRATGAADGPGALAVLQARDVDLVLLDVVMPDMSGIEVLARIKADTRWRDIPVVMISGVTEPDRVAHCIELGADDCLPKPFNPVLLRARIAACLEKKRLRDREALHHERVEAEQRRADELLRAILPARVAAELKERTVVPPRRHDGVAVLFCDIAGFTGYCDRNPPERVVSDLQRVVHAYEVVMAVHGMEKIKTIGDAVMATAGLLSPTPDPVLTAVRCGFDLIAATKRCMPHWQARVGIHAGSVVAGVIGRRQFLYDLWGDTVNIAARITAWAPPDSVVVSGDAWRGVTARCPVRTCGRVELKGKGLMELVEPLAPPAAARPVRGDRRPELTAPSCGRPCG
ncbi:adenylate/guanylate cyclase domain-containing protein [Azospirillum sp. ST 5-10]|uniref:adenylate/guanylate cyclase domain-containing protein n=1 Tax=unclassified Azospirillum TaxID=2630922 RepID=UPI003F4A6545